MRARWIAAALLVSSILGCVSLVDKEVLATGDGCTLTRVRLFTIHLDAGSPLRLYENQTQANEKLGLLQVWSSLKPKNEQSRCLSPAASGDAFLARTLGLHDQIQANLQLLERMQLIKPYFPEELSDLIAGQQPAEGTSGEAPPDASAGAATDADATP